MLRLASGIGGRVDHTGLGRSSAACTTASSCTRPAASAVVVVVTTAGREERRTCCKAAASRNGPAPADTAIQDFVPVVRHPASPFASRTQFGSIDDLHHPSRMEYR